MGILRKIVDELHLEGLALLLHKLEGLAPGQLKPLQLQLLLADLPHLGLDLGQMLGGKGEGGVHVVVPALVDRGADGQLDFRPQPLHGLGHHVGAGVPVGLAVFRVFKGVLKIFFCHTVFLLVSSVGAHSVRPCGRCAAERAGAHCAPLPPRCLRGKTKRFTPEKFRGEAVRSTVPPCLREARSRREQRGWTEARALWQSKTAYQPESEGSRVSRASAA